MIYGKVKESMSEKDFFDSLKDGINSLETLLKPLTALLSDNAAFEVITVDSFTLDLCKQKISEVHRNNQDAAFLFLSVSASKQEDNDSYKISLSFLNEKKTVLHDMEGHDLVYIYKTNKIDNSVVRILKGEDNVMISL